MSKQCLIGVSLSFMLAIGLLLGSELAVGQDCKLPPSKTAVEFLRDFERAPSRDVLKEIFERYVSRDRRFTLQELDELKREVVGSFGARPEKTFREPEILGIKNFSAGNVRGAEVTLLAYYPNNRVTQVTRLVCERDSWKILSFEFRP